MPITSSAAPDITGARASDHGAIVRLLDAADLPYRDVTPAMLAHFLVVWREGELCGVIGLEPFPRVGLLRSLAVAGTERGRGLGIALTRALERHARDLGIEELYLLTTTADRFFGKLGYRQVPRGDAPAEIRGTTEFRELCAESSVLMARGLE